MLRARTSSLILLAVFAATTVFCLDAATADAGDPRIQRAEMVEKCKKAHGMSRATETKRNHVPIPDGGGATYLAIDRFQFCQWPPSADADPDGYSEITYRASKGPGDFEASGVTIADRFHSTCKKLRLYYSFGTQGHSEHLGPFVATVGNVVELGGAPYDDREGPLGFYPDRDELVVLLNDRYMLDRAECVETSTGK